MTNFPIAPQIRDRKICFVSHHHNSTQSKISDLVNIRNEYPDMRDYLLEYPIEVYGRERYEKVLNDKIKAGCK